MSPRPTGDPKPVPTEGVNPELVSAYETIRTTVVPSTRVEGWNGGRQRRFLEAIADGETVRDACRAVQLSPQSAYAFRRTAKGAGFDLGWKAADLLARERVAADLMIRAVEGQEQETTRADGSVVTRTYKCNRLALAMLNRLDRYADSSERTAPGQAARLVASDFESFLQLVGEEGGPARAGLYMLARGADGEGTAAELEPVVALARADRLIRCGTALEVATDDLDPARRAEWTGEQWARAEVAGVVALAPKPSPAPVAEKPVSRCQPASTDSPADPRLDARDLAALDKLRRLGLPLDGPAPPAPREDLSYLDEPVWWDEEALEWRTRFPPPPGFDGYERHDFGAPEYDRTLTPEEEEVAVRRLGPAYGLMSLQEAEAERELWFREAAGDEGEAEVDESADPASGSDPLSGPSPSDVEGEAALGAAAESGDPVAANAASPASGSDPLRGPNPSDVKGEAALALLGAGDESDVGMADDATSPSSAGEPGAPQRPDSFDVKGEAALALLGASDGSPDHTTSTPPSPADNENAAPPAPTPS